MARVFRFVDASGRELHTINDPQEKLPVPETSQVISIGRSRMQVESVTLTTSNTGSVYYVRVWTVPAW